MSEKQQANSDSGDPKNNDSGLTNGYRWQIIFGSAVAFLVLAFVSRNLPYLQERAKFFTENALSLAILIAVIVQAIISSRQWKAMTDGVARTDNVIKEMEQQRTLAKDSAIYAQRAYVTAKIRGTGEGSHQWRLRIENSGSTPANNVCVYYSAEFRETPPWDWEAKPFREMPEDQIIFESVLMENARLGVIAPNSSYHVVRTPKVEPLFPEDRKEWIAGNIKFFCWGVIVYEDIFKARRYTYFCFFESQRHPNGYPCEHGNQAG
jgi:hypothetical protein